MKEGKDSCPICLETCDVAPSVVQPCNHAFCHSCIGTWAAVRPTCPLCLEPFSTISVSHEQEEDSKEEIIRVRENSTGYKLQEEDFECLDHSHFTKQFQALLKQAKEAEFELKAQVAIKKRSDDKEKNYQLVLHMKEEIGMKLLFLAQERKIVPKELLEEIEHFSNLLRKVRYGDKSVATLEYFEEEEYYYGDDVEEQKPSASGFSLFDVAVKKTSNSKKKNNKKGKGNKWNKEEIHI